MYSYSFDQTEKVLSTHFLFRALFLTMWLSHRLFCQTAKPYPAELVDCHLNIPFLQACGNSLIIFLFGHLLTHSSSHPSNTELPAQFPFAFSTFLLREDSSAPCFHNGENCLGTGDSLMDFSDSLTVPAYCGSRFKKQWSTYCPAAFSPLESALKSSHTRDICDHIKM
jgi:hypothetical protein